MKRTILSALFLSLSVSMMAAQAANDPATVKAQLDSQKDLVIDNTFYPATAVSYQAPSSTVNSQLEDQNVFYTNEGIFVPSFKEQLDSQKEAIRDYKFYPATAVSYQDASGALKATFKNQLDSQKELLKDYTFYPATNVFYTNNGVMLPSFKDQLNSQKEGLKDYKFYPAANVYYTEEGVYAPSVKIQLDGQKEMVKDYKFYPANNVSYK